MYLSTLEQNAVVKSTGFLIKFSGRNFSHPKGWILYLKDFSDWEVRVGTIFESLTTDLTRTRVSTWK